MVLGYNPELFEWCLKHRTLSCSDFEKYARSRSNSMPFPDVTGKMSLQAMQIEHFTFGSWQSTWDVHSVITGLLKLLGKYNPSSLLSQPEIDQVLLVGKAPGRWMSDRHFGNHNEYSGPLDIPFICGPWCIDDMHFVVFFLCQNYWTILDPAT